MHRDRQLWSFSFTLHTTRYHGEAKSSRPPLLTRICSRCLHDIYTRLHVYETAIQDTSWIYRVSEKLVRCIVWTNAPTISSLPQEIAHPTRRGRTKDTRIYEKISRNPLHKMDRKPKRTEFIFLGFCS